LAKSRCRRQTSGMSLCSPIQNSGHRRQRMRIWKSRTLALSSVLPKASCQRRIARQSTGNDQRVMYATTPVVDSQTKIFAIRADSGEASGSRNTRWANSRSVADQSIAESR
jgi:hypothetical protein